MSAGAPTAPIRLGVQSALAVQLANFSEELPRKPMFVVATKMDVAQDSARLAALRAAAAAHSMPVYEISAVTGSGIEELLGAVAQAVLTASSSSA